MKHGVNLVISVNNWLDIYSDSSSDGYFYILSKNTSTIRNLYDLDSLLFNRFRSSILLNYSTYLLLKYYDQIKKAIDAQA